MTKLKAAVRRHLPFLVVVPLLIIAMTFPTIIRIFDSDGFWLVQHNIDSNMLFWDAWYFEALVAGQADYFFTELLFHPAGVSLAYHNFNLPHMALLAALKLVLPPANAFNLAYLLLAFTTAAAGYLYLHYLFRDKWLALFGCIVFGLCGFVLARPAQIHISFIAPIPLALYCLHRALDEDSWKLMLLAGGIIGATAFIGLYTLVCLLITVGCFVLSFAWHRWRIPRFWFSILLLLGASAALAFPRVYPMIRDSQALSGALSKNADLELGTDLMWYFVNYKHPVLEPIVSGILPIVDKPGWDRVVYLGYIPLILLAFALLKRRTRRAALPWLGLALIFLILRLGSTLTFNSTHYPDILLPKHYLDEIFPFVFKAFWTPDAFLAGALLPQAVLSCMGLASLIRMLPSQPKPLVVLLLCLALAFEYYQEQRHFELPAGRLDFVEWLRQEEDQDAIHVINLPMGGQNSKVYAFYQTYSGYPHAEGRPTRTPSSAFAYADSNLLLSNWRAGRAYNCLPDNQDEFRAAQAQLLADGFTHIMLHRDRIRGETVGDNFSQIKTAYSDSHVSIYRLAELDASCALPSIMSADARAGLADLDEHVVIPWGRAAILSVHESATGEVRARLYSLRADTALGSDTVVSELAKVDVILLAADASENLSYRDWLFQRFAACELLRQAEATGLELFLRRDYPCELALSDAPLRVQYDNGIELGNLLTERDGDRLKLHLLWTRLPAEAHAFSAQVFDASGEKALQGDIVFHHEALSQLELDLSALPPGDYTIMLIVYNFETQATVPGTVVGSQHGFERQLEIARLWLEA